MTLGGYRVDVSSPGGPVPHLDGKVAIVTGAGGGIGRAIAARFVGEGALEEQLAPGAPAAAKEGFLGLVPLRRYATNEEVASIVLFLAGDESAYCTGGSYVVDGGFTAG